jgi:hypothetical protein
MSTSGGNGGGKGFFDELVKVESFSGKGNFFENIGKDILNYGVQAGTGGWLGYEDGKISNGVTTNIAKKTGQATVSGIKEITGAKAAEDANEMARDQFNKAQADAEAARLAAINQAGKDQTRQSLMAGASRSSAARSANRGMGIGGGNLGDERDFLGL